MNSAWSGVGTEKVPHLSLPLAICLLHAAPSAVLPKPDMCLKASHLSSANEQENVTTHKSFLLPPYLTGKLIILLLQYNALLFKCVHFV